jgi:hypothetical protein
MGWAVWVCEQRLRIDEKRANSAFQVLTIPCVKKSTIQVRRWSTTLHVCPPATWALRIVRHDRLSSRVNQEW